MKNKTNIKRIVFWVTESALLAIACIFAFAMMGYSTIALLFVAVAGLVALYAIINYLCRNSAKTGRRLKVALTSLICIGLALFIAVEIPIVAASRTDENPKADYLIVLGAGVNGTVPSLSLLNRLTAAKAYLDKYPDAVAIVSGAQGPGEDITEAECMRQWLEAQGIAPQRIIMEDRSTSTYTNIKYSLEIIKQDGGDPTGSVAIVSSEYHLYRAKYLAKELGAQPLGVAGHTSYPVMRFNYFLRESAAVLFEWLA